MVFKVIRTLRESRVLHNSVRWHWLIWKSVTLSPLLEDFRQIVSAFAITDLLLWIAQYFCYTGSLLSTSYSEHIIASLAYRQTLGKFEGALTFTMCYFFTSQMERNVRCATCIVPAGIRYSLAEYCTNYKRTNVSISIDTGHYCVRRWLLQSLTQTLSSKCIGRVYCLV